MIKKIISKQKLIFMKKALENKLVRAAAFFCLVSITMICCKKEQGTAASPGNPAKSGYQQVNLVSDVSIGGSGAVDGKLLNPWGIAIGPTGAIWISDNHSGVTTIYDNNGNTLLAPVSIPFNGQPAGGAPTGVVFNPNSVSN